MKRSRPEIPEGKCPACRTADLTYGRTLCQGCGLLKIVRESSGR